VPANKPAGTPAWGPDRGLLVVAALLAVGGLAWFLFSTDSPPEVTAGIQPAPPASRPSGDAPGLSVWRIQENVPTWQAPHPNPPVTPDPERDNDPTRDLSSYVPRGEKPKMADVITRLNEAGVYTGLGAFSPPGTRPPLIGLAVPEDFALPPGYVRHHQATDDGQRIEAILMFAPGYQKLDAQQQPVEMPKNRVVPPELAPPGLPIRRIVIPPPVDGPN
jgi:hypothetical protein